MTALKVRSNFSYLTFVPHYINYHLVVGMTINESNSRLNFKMINISLNPGTFRTEILEFQEKLESKNRSILKELQART